MKKNFFNKAALKRAFIFLCCALVFFGGSYAYLSINLESEGKQEAEAKDYTVPYEKLPDDKGVLFTTPDNSAVLVYLSFTDSAIRLLNIESYNEQQSEYFGYSVDFTINADYALLGGIIDRIGGLNLETEGQFMRYTGVQVIDMLSSSYGEDIKSQVIFAVFEQISKNNFSKEDFVYIIENSDTDLTVPDCYYWPDYIADMSRRVDFVN